MEAPGVPPPRPGVLTGVSSGDADEGVVVEGVSPGEISGL
jgi:hypothetical protein